MPKRTYIDSNILIAAFLGQDDLSNSAFQLIDDKDRHLVASDAVRLETLPKPHYEGNQIEVDFYETIFAYAEMLPWDTNVLYHAQQLAEENGIAAMDAIHISFAISAKVDEFVTKEKPTKPMFRVLDIPIRSISSA
ncbi:type II toxin-antitoxin system VapC family toxin [Acidithiobacillus ferrivorans]|uniref:PIN domain-containing protein n=1 Tax=Acidithiobacillus ferrivorans TaxID=160808 RepID=A0A7T4WDA7_9PROT|nr:PIN domain-containing protein [Acidithiobacillus ferrivorans]QQD72305.1 PIN domain-containing protein [Acidithiobacillus ferrivorans]